MAPAHSFGASDSDDPVAPGVLSLRIDDPDALSLQPGEQLVVTLAMASLQQPVSGYQAFLEFDPGRLTFVTGNYLLPDPFGLPLIYPIEAEGGFIDLAAGVNPLMGQPPTTADADLVLLTFEAAAAGTTRIRFRVHEPPTLLSTEEGGVVPELVDSSVILVTTCPGGRLGDFDCDDDVDAADFAVFADCLAGPDVIEPPAGCDPADFAKADLDAERDVDLVDFALLQALSTGEP